MPQSNDATGTVLQQAEDLSSANHGSWRESKWLAIAELIVVALIFLADARHLIPFSKTPFLLLFGWISLRVRRTGWRRIGVKLYRNWKATIALGISAGMALEALEVVRDPTAARQVSAQASRSGGV